VNARGTELQIGPYRLARPTLAFSEDYDPAHVAPGATGLVGIEVLRRFRVTYDYTNKRMYLEPNVRLEEPFIYDASGLSLRAAAPEFRRPIVSKVAENSAAAQSGIQAGDVLLEIDALSADDLPLDQVRALLRDPGKSHQLKFRRKDKTLDLTLHTRDLLP
jgi:C-terminal processing protease CtpA/Prc